MEQNKIPVGEVVSSSLNFAWDNIFALLRVGWFPLLASWIFSLAAQYPVNSGGETLFPPAVNGVFVPVSFLLSYLLWAVFAVAVHRMILFEEEAPPGLLYFRLTGEELRYSVAPLIIGTLLFGIIGGVFLVALGPEILFGLSEGNPPVEDSADGTAEMSGITGFLIFVALVVGVPFGIFIAMRLTMILPAIVDKGIFAFRHAWVISKGNVWRLIGVQFLLSFAFTILFAAFALVIAIVVAVVSGLGIPLTEDGEMSGTLIGTIVTGVGSIFFILFLGTVASIAILSYSYQALTEEPVDTSDDGFAATDEL